jgi:two-component system, cell cycle sensor histidine kinase and response regulator CckA
MCAHFGCTTETTFILLVDDESVIRKLCRELLNHAGYRVLIAADGKEAIEVYKSRKHEIALVILDLVMPRMNGWKCLAELRKIDPSVCVLVWSGSPLADLPEEDGEFRVFGYLPKSCGAEALLKRIREALDRHENP